MPNKWYVVLWLRFRARFFCPLGLHFGTWKTVSNHTWCPNCQQVVRYAPPKKGEL